MASDAEKTIQVNTRYDATLHERLTALCFRDTGTQHVGTYVRDTMKAFVDAEFENDPNLADLVRLRAEHSTSKLGQQDVS